MTNDPYRLSVRDTAGTALYFAEYDVMRHLLGRLPSGEQGPTPSWAPIYPSLVPFACGSFAGVSSWAIIYPLDVLVALFYSSTFPVHYHPLAE
jgi:solute carrier family 25 carnitine/acylcarnitine transporter 20/29